MQYIYTTIEEYVHVLYRSIDISSPLQLDEEDIAARLGLSVIYAPLMSFYSNGVIIIDDRLSKEKQWQNFTHELGHALLHVGNRFHLPPPFVAYQEEQANIFSRHACIPTAMLHDLDLPDHETAAVDMLCTTFCVEPEFARLRLHQYIRNHLAQNRAL